MRQTADRSLSTAKHHALDLRVWDVGKGSAMYLNAAAVQDVVFDLGYDDFSPMDYLVSRYGVNQIDLLCITHPHHDHIDDIDRIFEHGIEPRLLYRPQEVAGLVDEKIEEERGDNEHYVHDAELYRILDEKYSRDADEDPASSGWANGVTVSLYPVKEELFDGPRYKQMNNASPIIVVDRLGFTVVVTGDNMQKNLETALLNPELREDIKNADVLIAPHHGRKSSYSHDFVSHVNPSLVVFSDEKDKELNHSMYYQLPSGLPVLNEATQKVHTERKVLTTRQDGRIRIRANNSGDSIVSFYPTYSKSKVKSRRAYQKATRV